MNSPPINPNRLPPSPTPADTQDIPDKKNQTIEDTALSKLPSETETQKAAKKTWSWLPWRKKDDQAIEQKEEKKLEEDEKEGLTEENLGESPNDLDLAQDFEESESQLSSANPNDSYEDDLGLSVSDFEIFGIPKKNPPQEIKAPQLDGLAEKTQEVGKNWWMRQKENLLGGIKIGTEYLASGGGTKAIQATIGIYGYFREINKENEIAASKQIMRNNLEDPQYIEFFEFVRELAKGKAQDFIKNSNDQEFVGYNVTQNRDLIIDLVEINVARGFANMAVEINSQKAQIPHYNEQPSFVSLLSLISNKASAHINTKTLKATEEYYRKFRITLRTLTKKLLPNIESEPEKLALIQEVIQKKGLDSTIARAAMLKLFPDYETADGVRKEEIEKFQETLIKLNQRDGELKKGMEDVAIEILKYMFPNKFSDMKIPVPGFVVNLFYNLFAKNTIVSFLKEFIDPLENDQSLVQEWENDLKTRVGVPDLGSLYKAPTALAGALTKSLIQSDPRVVALTAGSLSSILQSRDPLSQEGQNKIKRINAVLTTPLSPEQLKQLAQLSDEQLDELNLLSAEDFNKRIAQITLLSQLSQEGLASWLVKSVQVMLHTDDQHLVGLGNFFQNGFNNLILALLAQGSKLVIPQGAQVKNDQFLKELSDQIVKKFSSMPQVDLKDQFWKDLVKELPLPSFLKDQLIALLIEKTKSVQTILKNSNPQSEIQKILVESEQTIQNYAKGKELLLITEKLSNQIVEQVLEKKEDFISSLGLENTVEELLAQYMPGVHINDDLIKWFKNNVTTLGGSNGAPSAQYVEHLKLGIQIVLRLALINTIETNFKKNGNDYAAQLLGNIHQAFDKAISGFDQAQRNQLDKALDIQEKIKIVKSQIQNLKNIIKYTDKPQNLTPEQQILITEAVNANVRQIRAIANYDNLIIQRNEILVKLNQNTHFCDAAQLPIIREAVILQKTLSSNFTTKDQFNAEIQKRRDGLVTSPNKNESEVLDMLDGLLALSPENLQLVLEVLNVESTIQNASSEIDYLKKDILIKKLAIDQYNITAAGNVQDWDAAKNWLKEVQDNRQEMSQLSQELASLLKNLDTHLKPFQVLSKELFGLIGLNQKDKLHLPVIIQDSIWPLIEKVQNQDLARILFEQLSPFLRPVLDIDQNREKLQKLSNGSQLLSKLAEGVSKEVVDRIPTIFISYKSFAKEMLFILGQANSTQEEVERMENALLQKMGKLGKEGAKAAMFIPILEQEKLPKDKIQAISAALEQHIAQMPNPEITKDDILLLLKKEINPANQKEEQELENQSQKLSKSLNQFLLNRGKARLTNQDLLDAYENQKVGNQPAVQPDQIQRILKELEDNHQIERMKSVAITPEEIAVEINDLIPGATELHTIIGTQLQNVITGRDQTLVANRERLQHYIEGVLLGFFVKIAESNSDKDRDVLNVLTQKLKEWTDKAHPIAGKKPEDVARELIDQLLADVLGIVSEKDIEGIPSALQKVVYDKLKEQAYEQLTPLILPIIEREENHQKLQKLSGSKFMGNICKALSSDAFSLIPAQVDSYRSIADKVYSLLSDGKKGSPAQIEQFANDIAVLAANSKLPQNQAKNVTNKALLQAYLKVASAPLTGLQLEHLKVKLEESTVKEEIKKILKTPEEIAKQIVSAVPFIDSGLQKSIANGIQGLMHENPAAYENLSNFAGGYVEGILLRVFIRVAEKNPKIKGKDTFVILTEKLLDIAAAKYPELNAKFADKDAFEKAVGELDNAIINDILGIDSADVFEGLPEPLKEIAYQAIKDQLGAVFIQLRQTLSGIGANQDELQKVKLDSKNLGIQDKAEESYLHVVTDQLANRIVTLIGESLVEQGEDQLIPVNRISMSIQSYLEELSRFDVETSKVLLNYTKGPQFQKLLEEKLLKFGNKNEFLTEKEKLTQLLSDILLVPFHRLFNNVIDFERKKGAAFNQDLMANIFVVAADYLKNLNAAKKIAAVDGRAQILHKDYVEAAGAQLHPGVPKTFVTYQEALDAISRRIYGLSESKQIFDKLKPEQQSIWIEEQKNLRRVFQEMIAKDSSGEKILQNKDIIIEINKSHIKVTGGSLTKSQVKALRTADEKGKTLKDLIRQESEVPILQRRKEAFTPASKTVMKLLFPNGKKDLTFVPEEMREMVWGMFKKNLFPSILPSLTSLLLDPDTINSMVLSSLETVRDSMLPLNELSIENLVSLYNKGLLLSKKSGEIIRVNSKNELLQLVKEGKVIAKLEDKAPQDETLNDLDRATGALIAESIQMVKLPEWVKKLILDPQTGKLPPAMQKTLGETMRQNFHAHFIRDGLDSLLEKLGHCDANGKYIFDSDKPIPDPALEPKKAKELLLEKERVKVKSDLKRVSREVVDVSIAFFVRNQWKLAQARFDEIVKNAFGKIGIKLKNALDAVFRFIFFKIVGSFLSLLISPVKGWVKDKIYNFISLDENRDLILGFFQRPPDQLSEDKHAVYNEDLVYRLGRALQETVEKALVEPLIPISPDLILDDPTA